MLIRRMTDADAEGVSPFGWGKPDYFATDFIDARTGWIVGPPATALHTDDGGQTWVDQSLPPNLNWVFDVDFTDASHGWCLVEGGILFRTVNGGENWTEQQASDGQLRALRAEPDGLHVRRCCRRMGSRGAPTRTVSRSSPTPPTEGRPGRARRCRL